MKALKRQVKIERPKKEIVTREEALKRVKDFPKREEKTDCRYQERCASRYSFLTCVIPMCYHCRYKNDEGFENN